MLWTKRSLVAVLFSFAGLASMAGTVDDPAVLTLVHGVPGTAVDVCLGDTTPGSFVKIATNVGYTQTLSSELPVGAYNVTLVAVGAECAGGVIPGLSLDILLLPGTNVSVVAGLSADGAGLAMTQFMNDVTTLNTGRELVVRHVAAATPALDFRYGRIFPRTRIEDLEFGMEKSRRLFASRLRTDVTLANTSNRVQGPTPVFLNSRHSIIVYIVGSLADDTIDIAVQKINRRQGLDLLDVTASFTPDQPTPGANTVSLNQALTFGPLAVISVGVTDTTGVYGTSFDVLFDPATAVFLTSVPGALLEQDGSPVTYSAALSQAGRLAVSASRVGPVGGVDATGTIAMIRLVFLTPQVGTSAVQFDNQMLLDDVPSTIPGISWFGGTLEAN